MLFAVLELTDFAVIMCIVALFSGGAAATVYLRPVDRNRLERVEQKLDLILTHLGLDYTEVLKARWQELATDPTRKIAAIKAYRELHGVGLAEAKRAVEEYMHQG
jgi:ribosomal protein L7/L12